MLRLHRAARIAEKDLVAAEYGETKNDSKAESKAAESKAESKAAEGGVEGGAEGGVDGSVEECVEEGVEEGVASSRASLVAAGKFLGRLQSLLFRSVYPGAPMERMGMALELLLQMALIWVRLSECLWSVHLRFWS
jgi:hypothetical protein